VTYSGNRSLALAAANEALALAPSRDRKGAALREKRYRTSEMIHLATLSS
jgi:hypothetical protein